MFSSVIYFESNTPLHASCCKPITWAWVSTPEVCFSHLSRIRHHWALSWIFYPDFKYFRYIL